MWETQHPKPVKLICGILAADTQCLETAVKKVVETFGSTDHISQVYPFDMTQYYQHQAGDSILRQFVSIEKLIDPGQLIEIKLETNTLEVELANSLDTPYPRPINLDPGYLEPSKLVLASTKNFAHRIYIGQSIWAEVTLTYNKGLWQSYPYTFPDFKSGRYNDFLTQVREKLSDQLRHNPS